MYSKQHFLISVLVGVAVAVLAGVTLPLAVATVGYAAVLGVGVDFDHFLVARLNTGRWDALIGVIRNPRRAFLDQEDIFEEGKDVTKIQRLLSHVVLGGLLVAVLYPFLPYFAVVSAVVLYVHVLCDLYQDVRDEAEARSPHGQL
jgi:ABC-type Mn2+/Zn2+ transport system permease subunit